MSSPTRATEQTAPPPGSLVQLQRLKSARGTHLNSRFAITLPDETQSATRVALLLLPHEDGTASLSISVANLALPNWPSGALVLAYCPVALAQAEAVRRKGAHATAVTMLRAMLSTKLLPHDRATEARLKLSALLADQDDTLGALAVVREMLNKDLAQPGESKIIRRAAHIVLSTARSRAQGGGTSPATAQGVARAEEMVRSLGEVGDEVDPRKQTATDSYDPDLMNDLILEETYNPPRIPTLPPPPGSLVLLRRHGALGLAVSPPIPHGDHLRVAVHPLPWRVGAEVGARAMTGDDVVAMETGDGELGAEVIDGACAAARGMMESEPVIVPVLVRNALKCVKEGCVSTKKVQKAERLGLQAERLLTDEVEPEL